MRIRRMAITAVLLITLSIIAFPVSAADIQDAAPTTAVAVNGTPLYTVATRGPSAPLSTFEKPEEITIFRIELNQTTFPGPRSMAFGPRYIQLTASPATLIILFIGVSVGGVALFIIYMRKKAGANESASTEEESRKEDCKNGNNGNRRAF